MANKGFIRVIFHLRIEKEDSYEEILMSKESAANKTPGVYINNDYDVTTADNSDDDEDTDITDGQRSSQDQGNHDDDKLIYSSEEKMMISITGNTESIFSNKLRIEVNNKNCLLYTSPSPRDGLLSRMPSSA